MLRAIKNQNWIQRPWKLPDTCMTSNLRTVCREPSFIFKKKGLGIYYLVCHSIKVSQDFALCPATSENLKRHYYACPRTHQKHGQGEMLLKITFLNLDHSLARYIYIWIQFQPSFCTVKVTRWRCCKRSVSCVF